MSFKGGLAPPPSVDPLETLSGPQTPRRLSSPLTQNPGSAPDNHIGCVMVSCYPRVWKIFGSSPGLVKPTTIKLVFVASPLGTQH